MCFEKTIFGEYSCVMGYTGFHAIHWKNQHKKAGKKQKTIVACQRLKYQIHKTRHLFEIKDSVKCRETE